MLEEEEERGKCGIARPGAQQASRAANEEVQALRVNLGAMDLRHIFGRDISAVQRVACHGHNNLG